MKKNVLALSIAAMIGGLGFAGAAAAQSFEVNDTGTGHILINPYYTAQNGNMSVFHVVNTDTVNGKAVKVRFRGASNSDDVLDFQVFMSPGDVWTAAVSKGADGRAELSTSDNSCTLPSIGTAKVPFVLDRLPANMSAEDKANNTREGYMEILTMADIDMTSALGKTIKHANGTAACAPAVMETTLAGDVVEGLVPPTGQLFGSWYIINVAQTTTFSGASNAIVATPATGDTTRSVFSPQSSDIALAGHFSADPLIKSGVMTAQQFDFPDLSTPYFTSAPTQAGADAQASALTAALARTSVMNQYANDVSITAKTDWVFSLPTRRYNIAANYAAPAGTMKTSSANASDPIAQTEVAYRLINDDIALDYFTAANTKVNDAGQICLASISSLFVDREETTSTASGAVFSPGNATQTSLCGEVSVLSFSDKDGVSVLGASVARGNVDVAYMNGWGSINFDAPGVPVLGSAFIKLTNPNAMPGMAGTYGITWPHAYK